STIGPPERWSDPLAAALTGEELRVYPDMGNPDDIDVALFARQQPGLFPQLRNLRLIIGLQAGVESLLDDAELPADIPIVRSTQPDGDRMIAEYVLMHVLRHHRNMPDFLDNQRDAKWEKPPVLLASERRVGFMGLGVIAHPCVVLVRDLGFQTASWTRTPNDMDGVENFHGAAGLEPFLNRSDIMVNVLPLTTETEDILDTRTLAMLPEDAKIINIGRGQHIVDEDLMAALDSGRLGHATLDVFRTEPLPGDHPFWAHPGITVMPHTARHSQPSRVAPQVAENIRRLRAGEPFIQPVNRDAGY
ncbi:MAG: glyoxylate/hydroxypyruvate reductase A, partial [Rhodospirillaceae bacterium]|nr:glyoxylate/hydroxypyruvate reductase A [Rhodospirillaceae bacterium]